MSFLNIFVDLVAAHTIFFLHTFTHCVPLMLQHPLLGQDQGGDGQKEDGPRKAV